MYNRPDLSAHLGAVDLIKNTFNATVGSTFFIENSDGM
jgi:hypothetical protein